MKPSTYFIGLALLGLAGCNQVREEVRPVLGDDVTLAEEERFAHRLYLDLTGLPPTPDQKKALVGRLEAEGNTAKTRAAVAAEIMARPESARLFLTEVESEAYSGQPLDAGYDLVCQVTRSMDPECGPCQEDDSCKCQCPAIVAAAEERKAYDALAQDFASGGDTRTSDIERALCKSAPFLFNNTSAEGISTQLFQTFLTRPPEPDELSNARFMTIGSFVDGAPAGMLFHRLGGSYDDLLDIVFESEVYRDAMVTRVFSRYLGRSPSGDELRFFSASLDPERPDMRSLVHAVVSSLEYFHQ